MLPVAIQTFFVKNNHKKILYEIAFMKKIAVIPARYASVRFPGKLMRLLDKKTIIRTTYDNTVATNLFADVFVVTDSEIIFNEITQHSGNAIMSRKNHESGSDRIAEAIENIDCEVILNVQGDEPFVNKEMLRELINAFDASDVQVASLMHVLYEQADIENTGNAKVVVDKNSDALYFSRAVIPFIRDEGMSATYYNHIGIYAYRKNVLLQFAKWKQTSLEKIEKLEQLRYLEHGVKIRMIVTNQTSIGIDTPGDLELARQFVIQQKNNQA